MKKLGPTTIPILGAQVMLEHQTQYLARCPDRRVKKSRRVEFAQRVLPSGGLAARKPDYLVLTLECGHEVTHSTKWGVPPDRARCLACGPGAK